MPLLNKKHFELEPIPSDLKPDEEVFVCQPTKEIFRDYEKYFNRIFQCNSHIWSCELTGTSGLTYTQALASEEEATKLINSLDVCYQRAALRLVHHAVRTNIKVLADEICAFYRDRFIKEEVIDLTNVTSSGAKILQQVKIVRVICPPLSVHTNGSSTSPIRVSVITNSPQKLSGTSPQITAQSSSNSSSPHEAPLEGKMTNGIPSPGDYEVKNPSSSESNTKPESKTRTPQTPRSPLSPELNLDPAQYKYVVRYVSNPESELIVRAGVLSRPKGLLTPKKLKVFLRNAMFRASEKHPFAVKEEYVEKFDLGKSSINFTSLLSPSRKRSLSQTKLDSFFSPGAGGTSMFSLSDNFLYGPRKKKSRPTSLMSDKQKAKKSNRKKLSSGKRTPKTPSSRKEKMRRRSSSKSSTVGKYPTVYKAPSLLSQSPQALKVLNKAKKFQQLDLKNSMFKKNKLTPAEIEELAKKIDLDRQWKAAQLEEEKKRRKEIRLRKLGEQQELRRQARIRQREWLKPREDLLCEDSKLLPEATPVKSSIPPELFGDAVMILEFLNTFGPLFNMKEVIRGGVTFEKIEYAITTQEMDSILFEITKFLLQAIFATMEEEYESLMVSPKIPKVSRTNSPETIAEDEATRKNVVESNPSASVAANDRPHTSSGEGLESKADQEVTDDAMITDEGMDDKVKSLDLQVENLKSMAVGYSQWPYLTQHLSLHEMVIDAYTLTEVLRLHLLSCGGYKDTGERSWFRHSRRGGFTDVDDPSISFRLLRLDICNSLARTPFYSFSAADKLEILSVLCSQLLTYSVAREFIDESARTAKKARRLIKEMHFTEERRKKGRKKEEMAKQKKEQEQVTNKNDDVEKQKKEEKERNEGGEIVSTDLNFTAEKEQVGTVTTTKSTTNNQEGVSAEKEVTGDQEVEDEEQHRLKLEEELHCQQRVVQEASASVNLRPIGFDRYHRKYLLFPSMNGLFVEDSGRFPLETDPVRADGDRTLTPIQDEVLINQPGSSEPSTSWPKWSCYSTPEEISCLIDSLNPRGIREEELKTKLESLRSHFEPSITKCIFSNDRTVPSSQPKFNSASEFFELYLREQILDIEEKIHVGNLGYTSDRLQWRNSLENSGAAAEILSFKQETQEETPSYSATPVPQQSVPICPIRELANALLQVQAGIGKKFLMPPLGTAIDHKKKRGPRGKEVKVSDVCLEQWRNSLGKATSFSQIFLHLATLERAVMWSKSLMNVRCRICRRKCGDEFMLLCDGCDHGYHTYCLKPPLKDVPDGDWFCYDCVPVTPIKPRRRVQRVVIVEESSESEEEEVESEEELEVGLQESEEEEIEEEVTQQRNLRSTQARTDPLVVAGRGRARASRGKRGRGRGRGRWSVPKADIDSREDLRPPRRGRIHPRFSSRGRRHQSMESSSTDSPPPSRARKKLKLDSLPHQHIGSKAESVIASIIDLRCTQGGRQHTGALRREMKGLEMQLCQALWEEISHHKDSWYFATPVKKKEYPDYFDAVSVPMDLRTVKSRIKCGDYMTIDNFLQDVLLIFSNSTKYHKRNSEIGKAGVTLKRYFEKRCSDLGLKDLQLSELDGGKRPSEMMSRRRQSSRLKH